MASPVAAWTDRPAQPAARPRLAIAPETVRLQHPEPPPPEAIMEYYRRSVDASFYSNGGPCARLLTDRLTTHLGGDVHCIPVGNCTTGLMAAVRAACGVPHGRRRLILTPSYTFTATACAIEWAGFQAAFVDVDEQGWHMDADSLEDALTSFDGEVAGVLACATFGTPPPCEQRAAWRDACARHGVPLLIDSAPGFGSRDEHGRRAGSMGDTEIFSFHATKPFSVGEGGLVVTADAELAARVERLVNFGLNPKTRMSSEIGFNAKMSELHAATALAMLDRFDSVLERRQATAMRLGLELSDLPLTLQQGSERCTWQIFHALCPSPASRERCLELSAGHGVEVRTMHDPPLHRHAAFAGRRQVDLTVTERISARSIGLPMANQLSETAIRRIALLVTDAVDPGEHPAPGDLGWIATLGR
jgi:dTDP-4-amino-4,6-dideoxygalactose transaminase